MPKYLVEMHDGRKFHVEADSQPTEAEVLAHLGGGATPPQGDTYTGPDTYDSGYAESWKQTGRALGRSVLNALPGAGAILGGVIATPETLGAGSIAGAALGAGVGRGARDLIGHYTGLDAPSTPLEKAGAIAKDTAITGATAALLPGVITAAKTPIQTAREVTEQFGSAMPPVVKRLGNMLPAIPKAAPGPLMTRPAWQTWETSIGPDLSRPVQAGSLTQAEIAERINAVRAQGGLPAAQQTLSPTPTVGQLRLATGQGGPSTVQGTLRPAPPSPVETTPPAANWQTAVPDRVGSALDPARVDIGAEQAGRAAGLTKQQVRDVATPILDAAPGEASPILPEAALKRIIDTVKALPKGGPEREAYVAKATSGKTQWQVENIRRTLEHLGLIVPVATGAGLGLRETIRRRLSGSEQPVQ